MLNIPYPHLFSKISIVLSSVCIVHCLSFPILILALPTMAQFMSSTVELIIILSVIPISAVGFIPTWVKHKNKRLLYIYLGSLVLLLLGQFAISHSHESGGVNMASLEYVFETLLLLGGAFGMAWVIYKNNKHTHVCRNPHHQH